MPESLQLRMLSRAEAAPQWKKRILAVHRAAKKRMTKHLVHGELHEIICLSDRKTVLRGEAKASFAAEMLDCSLTF